MSRPSRPRAAGLAAAAAGMVLFAGCGKSNLPAPATTGRAAPHAAHATAIAPPEVTVPLTVPLTAARAGAFSRAVELGPADVPGSSASAPSGATQREREASRCGGKAQAAVGGGRSANLRRGVGLDRESISSSVEVLGSVAAVQGNLAYAESKAGLDCFARVLRASLAGEPGEKARLVTIRLGRLRVSGPGGQHGEGVRIAARVAVAGSGISVTLYTDAVSFGYGPAEIDLYASSFVQPPAVRTEQELLTLLRERARLNPL